MKYVPPIGGAPNAPYVEAVPAAAIEYPMREIVAAITGAGLTPTDADLAQLWEAIKLGMDAPNRPVAGSMADADKLVFYDVVAGIYKAITKANFLSGIGVIDQVRDQIALTNIRLMLNASVGSSELVRGKQWELATDEWGATSTNEYYHSGSPSYYFNAGGSTADVCNGGTASASSEYDTKVAAKAFNNSITAMDDHWYSYPGTVPVWIAYEFPQARMITQVTLQCNASTGGDPTGRMPQAFQVQAYVAGGWTTVHTVTGQTGWSFEEKRTYSFTNTTILSAQWRLYITAQNADGFVELGEVEMMETLPTTDMTLVSPTVDVSTVPTYVGAYFLYKDDSGTAVLGTDITCELSRDDGTTWTAGILTLMAAYDGTYSAIKARANVGAQPSGTSLKARIKTFNTKAQRVAAPALYAE